MAWTTHLTFLIGSKTTTFKNCVGDFLLVGPDGAFLPIRAIQFEDGSTFEYPIDKYTTTFGSGRNEAILRRKKAEEKENEHKSQTLSDRMQT